MVLDENKNDHLVELGGSDYEIAEGQPNIKGWDVKNEHGQKVGEVDELLFDPQLRKVRYIIVDLDDNVLGLNDDKKVLIPIGVAQLYSDDYEENTDTDYGIDDNDDEADNDNSIYNPERDGDVVIVPVTTEQLRELPAYQEGDVTPDVELNVRRIFEGTGQEAAGMAGANTTSNPAYNREDFYTHDHFNEDKFYDRGTSNTEQLTGEQDDDGLEYTAFEEVPVIVEENFIIVEEVILDDEDEQKEGTTKGPQHNTGTTEENINPHKTDV